MSVLYELLYVSQFSRKTPVTAIANIIHGARRHNSSTGLTGVLVFDGVNFCQHIEGPQDEVVACMARIAQDSRHEEVQVLHSAPAPHRRFQQFSMGYAEPDGPDAALDHLRQLSGEPAIAAFITLVPALDLHG